MLRQLYGVDRKSYKWWHRLFFGLMDMAVVDSYVLYCEINQEKSTPSFDFRREIALALVTFLEHRRDPSQSKRRKIECSVPSSVRHTNVGIHKPLFSKIKADVRYAPSVEFSPALLASALTVVSSCAAILQKLFQCVALINNGSRSYL